MAAPRPRSNRSTSLRDSDDSEKLEGTARWDALEWTKVEVTRSVSHANLDLLLEDERVVVEGFGVVLVNTDEAGTLIVTNFRILFLSEGTRNIIALGTIPLATIEKFNKMAVKIQSAPRHTDKNPSRRLLQVIGKDMRIVVFGFRPKTKQALVEKDWLAFGHPFSDRVGMPTLSGNGDMSYELSRQSSLGSFQSSPMRQSSGSLAPQAPSPSHAQNNYSPIFLQWVDCVSQLMRMYPFAFEFSSAFLVDFLDCVLSCRFGNFLCNSEMERQQCGVCEACGCLWAYLADLRSSAGRSHVHYNIFYNPLKHNGPLLPPAAALAPTLWPQFHLRWACPTEAQSGELEAQCRDMALKLSELKKAKEVAEKKAKETMVAMESQTAELRKEKHLRISAVNVANRASRESEAVKRAIQSLGCKVQFSRSGDCTVDIESSTTESPLKMSDSKRVSDCTIQYDEKSDFSVSVTVMDDVSSNPIGRICEALCPLRTREGGCVGQMLVVLI